MDKKDLLNLIETRQTFIDKIEQLKKQHIEFNAMMIMWRKPNVVRYTGESFQHNSVRQQIIVTAEMHHKDVGDHYGNGKETAIKLHSGCVAAVLMRDRELFNRFSVQYSSSLAVAIRRAELELDRINIKIKSSV